MRHNFNESLVFNHDITINLSLQNQDIFKNLNGFYGLIGPNIQMNSIPNEISNLNEKKSNIIFSLYDLFTGDGLIQGVFFDQGKLTFVKHLIKTEKVLYERQNGKIIQNLLIKIIHGILNEFGIFPNLYGTANTAILNNGLKNYALFERDSPYLININFQNKNINTIEKINIENLKHFSGHSKSLKNGNIETIDYRIFGKKVIYYLLNSDLKIIDQFEFKFKYIPIIHDFYSNDKLLILIDSPLKINPKKLFCKIPISIKPNENTYIYVFDKFNKSVETYLCDSSFFTFHYSFVEDFENNIFIYLSIYDTFNFNDLKINGKYRKIEINKKTKKVTIIQNPELEKYNLDFPIPFEDKIILRNYEYPRINGFIIVDKLTIFKKIFFENKNICGEPSIFYLNEIPYLIFFNIENNLDLISFLNLRDYQIIDINIPCNLNLGFHSIFLQK